MAHIFIPNCVQVTLFGQDTRHDELLHVFHAATVDPLPTQAQCRDIADVVVAWVHSGADFFTNMLNEQIEVTRVVAQSIAEFEGPFWEEVISYLGIRTGDPVPSVLCAVIKKSTGLAGRTHRGYFAGWPPVVADLQTPDANLWDDGYITDLVATYNSLRVALNTAGYPMVVASRARADITEVVTMSSVTGAVRNRHTRAALIGR